MTHARRFARTRRTIGFLLLPSLVGMILFVSSTGNATAHGLRPVDAVRHTPDVVPPTKPTHLAKPSATKTSVSVTWTAARDNLGVAGYTVYLSGTKVATTTSTRYTVPRLKCGKSYTLAIDAYDAARNHSARARTTTWTSRCRVSSLAKVKTAGQLVSGPVCLPTYTLPIDTFETVGDHSAQEPMITSGFGCRDRSPPTQPTGLETTAATATSVSVGWVASFDDVGVAGYTVFVNGAAVGTTDATSFTVSGLSCWTGYLVAVDAFDAAGNHSTQAFLSTTTSACEDATAPTQPTGLAKTGSTLTSVSLGWAASTDDVGVAGYSVFVNGAPVATTPATTFTVGGLFCGTSYTVAVDAYDAAGNHSLRSSIFVVTAACPDTTAPTVSITGPAAGATVSGTVSVAASASDDVAVGSVEFWIDGVNRVTDTTAPYSYSWDTTVEGNGSHTILVKAFDSSGNSAGASITVTASNNGPCATSSSAWQNQPLPAHTGSFTVGFDSTPDGNNIDAVTGLSNGPASGYESLAAIVRFNSAGFIDARNGADYASASPIPYTAGTSYHVRLVVNLATHTYSTYVTPKGSAETIVGLNYAFRSEQASVTSLTNWALKDESGTAAVCRLVVSNASDSTPPSQPTGLAKTGSTLTSVSLGWAASTDDVGVAGYSVFVNGAPVATTPATTFTVGGLFCGTSYTVAVDAYDAAGNHSLRSSIFVVTAACPDTTAPTVSITGPAAGATVSGTVSVAASASDDVAVGSVEFWIDGVNRVTDTTAPYSYSWDTTVEGNGSHTILVKAFDSSGNSAGASITVTASNNGPCATSSSAWQNQPLPAHTGSFTVGFDSTPDGNNIDAVTGLSNGPASGYESLAAIVRFNSAGFIDARNGADYASASPIPYTAGTSYHVRLVVNLATHTYSTYVTPKGSAETIVGLNYAFRSEQASVTSLTNWALKDESGTAAVCRLVVSNASDSTPPSQPTGLAKTGSTLTSVSLGWAASTDDVGVAGYSVFVNGAPVATTPATTFTVGGLFCGTSYTVAVDAYDAAGNHSSPGTITVSTAACVDTQPPTQPTGLAQTGSTTNSLSVRWAASTDDVGVAGYTVSVNGAQVGTTAATSYAVGGLTCATTYTLDVDAYDAAGKHSTPAALSAATAACSSGTGITSTANVFVSPTGSDSGAKCMRYATAIAFPSDATSVCKSFDQAVTIASAGDTILAAGGSYGGQQINQHPKASAVSLYVVAGQTAAISGSLSVATDHLDLYGPFAISGTVGIANSDQTSFLAHDDSINNFSAANGYIKASHVLLKNGTIGPYHACLTGGEDGLLVSALYPSWTPSSYVTLDNVTVHDIDRWTNPSVGAASGTCAQHTDGIQTFGADHLTIRNSHIYRTATSLIMSKPEAVGEIEDNVTIENSMFGSTLEGGNGVLIGASGAPCYGTNTFLIQNNTVTGQGLRLGCSGPRAIVRSNILPSDSCSGIDRNGTYSYNVFAVGTTDTACIGSLHAKVCNPVYSDPNRASTGDYSRSAFDTCATDAGDPANFPATDIFGQVRGVGTAPDAAADEH